ncbi:YhcB family protein [Sessilibacter corallicola]|uniref:Z-ring associated protein G n=1 Tax=Sessilibacter corallicola TaxID=2904075 RepID=A0ABQ0A3K3_9GAMM|nr:YhcB family protein [Sessilibacter corallicola]
MFSITALILTGVCCILVGGGIGYFIGSQFSTDKQATKTMEARVERAEDELKSFQADVTEHFQQTSVLVNKLTETYRDVHEHLAGGAIKLANADIGKELVEGASKQWAQAQVTKELLSEDSVVEPPRDWAPNKGTLSESFGLENTQTHPDEEKNPTPEKVHTS